MFSGNKKEGPEKATKITERSSVEPNHHSNRGGGGGTEKGGVHSSYGGTICKRGGGSYQPKKPCLKRRRKTSGAVEGYSEFEGGVLHTPIRKTNTKKDSSVKEPFGKGRRLQTQSKPPPKKRGVPLPSTLKQRSEFQFHWTRKEEGRERMIGGDRNG